MEMIGLFEAKAKLSEICDRVKSSGEPVLITKRGVPYVKLGPLQFPEGQGSRIWELREELDLKNRTSDDDLELSEREPEDFRDPLDDDGDDIADPPA